MTAPPPGDRDQQQDMERIVSLARGPKGDKGEQGEQMHPGVRRAIVFLFVVNTMLIAAAYLLMNHQADVNEHKWCTTITTLDRADRAAPPPATQFGRQLVTDFHDLRSQLGCG